MRFPCCWEDRSDCVDPLIDRLIALKAAVLCDGKVDAPLVEEDDFEEDETQEPEFDDDVPDEVPEEEVTTEPAETAV